MRKADKNKIVKAFVGLKADKICRKKIYQEDREIKTKKENKIILAVPKGYDLEDVFDTDDSDFNEKPILSEEVKITFERDYSRKKQGV